ncbi:hypothetical protein IKE71_03755 [Candidatus Saccharibacteria bacterium]|nr:hypothetical protein [Candidatus Saccharibacteria bacterium]
MKIAKWVMLAIMAAGLIFAAAIISTCDYEDYCRDHGITPDTETNPLTALYGVAVAIPAAGAAYIIDGKERAR